MPHVCNTYCLLKQVLYFSTVMLFITQLTVALLPPSNKIMRMLVVQVQAPSWASLKCLMTPVGQKARLDCGPPGSEPAASQCSSRSCLMTPVLYLRCRSGR